MAKKGNPFAKFGVSDSEVSKALRESANVDAGINEFLTNQVIPYGRSMSPPKVVSGKYAASWKIIKKAKKGRAVVGPTDFKAAWLEFGTGAPGPTTAFAPVQKVVEHFGGDLKTGFSISGDE